VRVEMWTQDIVEDRVTIEIVVQDSGCGMSNEQLDALFRDLEQVTTDADLNMSDPVSNRTTPDKDSRTLGLGLAMVARIVRNMNGQLRLKSEEGKGSRFVIQLPFSIPVDDRNHGEEGSLKSWLPTVATPPLVIPEGEVTLVDKNSLLPVEGMVHKRSREEVASLQSFRSGSSNKSNTSKKSDVDRLIDAISGPLGVGEHEPDDISLHRSNSKGSGHSRVGAGGLGRGQTLLEHPGKLTRSRSYGAPEHLRSAYEGPAGSEYVTDNRTLLRAVRIPDEFTKQEEPTTHTPRVFFNMPDKKAEQVQANQGPQGADNLNVLVAEDDPINSRIIQKRLEKLGHDVHHTVNGEDCASAYGEKPGFFDVVLMDMQARALKHVISFTLLTGS